MKLDAILFSPVSAETTHWKVADRSSEESQSLCKPSEQSATPNEYEYFVSNRRSGCRCKKGGRSRCRGSRRRSRAGNLIAWPCYTRVFCAYSSCEKLYQITPCRGGGEGGCGSTVRERDHRVTKKGPPLIGWGKLPAALASYGNPLTDHYGGRSNAWRRSFRLLS